MSIEKCINSIELKSIFNKMISEKESSPPFQSIKLLCNFLNKNRTNTEEIIKNISLFFNGNDKIPDIIILNTVNNILPLLSENTQVINFLNMILPILVHIIYYNNKSISSINDLIQTIGYIIKKGGIYTRQIIENNIDSLFDKFSNDSKTYKYENTKYGMINFLAEVIESSPLITYNKIIEKSTFEIFLKVIDNFKDNNQDIRNSVGYLIKIFCTMVNKRENINNVYIDKIYNRIILQFSYDIKENSYTPNNYSSVNGILICLNNFPIQYFTNDKYKKFMDLINYCQFTKNSQIKTNYIENIPFFIQINSSSFNSDYSQIILPYIISLLIPKNPEFRACLLICIGKMSNILSQEIFSTYLNQFLNFISAFFERDIYEKEIFECLSKMLDSYNGIYKNEVLRKIDVFKILPKIFKTGMTVYHTNFLCSLLNIYNEESMEAYTLLIIILNLISVIISGEIFNFQYFFLYKKNFPKHENYDDLIENSIKEIKHYINDKKEYKPYKINENSEISMRTVNNCLFLLSKIKHKDFLEDILQFYNKHCLKFLTLGLNYIKRRVIEISSSSFIKIHQRSKMLSLYILNSIVDAFLDFVLIEKIHDLKYICLNQLIDNRIFYDIIIQNRKLFEKLISLISINDKEIRKKITKLVGILCSYSNQNNLLFTYIRKRIVNLILTINKSTDIIQKEDEIILLYYFTSYCKDNFDIELIDIISKNLLNIIQIYKLNPVLNSYILKIFSSLSERKDSKQLFKKEPFDYSDIILDICIENLKEGLNTSKTEISLKALYVIIKVKKMDIYIQPDLVNILIQILIKDPNEKRTQLILDIFSYCGIKSPNKLEKISKIVNSNRKKNDNFEEIINKNNNVDQSSAQAVISLMRILKDNSQQELSTQIISCLGSLIKSLQPNDSSLIDIIMPTLLEIIPQFDINLIKSMFENMTIILTNFPNKFKNYLKEFFHLIKKYIFDINYHDVIFQVLPRVFEQFDSDIGNYYFNFIPIFIKLLKEGTSEKTNIIYCFSIMANNNSISIYLDILLNEIFILYQNSSDVELCKEILNFVEKIIFVDNAFLHFPLIILNLIEKIEKGKNKSRLIKRSFELFLKMNNRNRTEFIGFLPLIIQTFRNYNLLDNYFHQIYFNLINYENYSNLTEKQLISRYINQICSIQCSYGINTKKINISPINQKNQNLNNIFPIKNRKTQTDKESIIKAFDTTNCIVSDDWKEWFKLTSEKLFQQSPSYALFYCHTIADYYFPLILELYNYGFISVWTNLNDYDKMSVINDLQKALEHKKTPNDILLAILNLAEFIERENGNIVFIDFYKLGCVAYKCKAFAKALYYKESDFINKNDYENLELLIELYYEVKLPESAIGLLKLAKRNNNNDNGTIFTDDYSWYIKLHNYQEALNRIKKLIKNNEKEKNKKDIKRDTVICLEGLCDWEELLNKNEEICDLECDFTLAKASLNMSEWDSLKKYTNIIKEKSNNDKELLLKDNNIFDFNLYSAITFINDNNFIEAKNYINKAKTDIFLKIKSLLSESFVRGYDCLIKNQMLYQLEEIIIFKEQHSNDINYRKEMVEQWDKRLEVIGNEDPSIFERLLSIRSIVLGIEEDWKNYLKLAKIFRRLNLFEQSEKLLNRMKKKINILDDNNSQIKEILIRIDYNINKCKYENEKEEEALNEYIKIIEDLNKIKNEKINKKLISKIYGLYGFYKYKKIKIELDENNNQYNEITNYLELSTKYYKDNYQTWHVYAMLNNLYYEYLSENNNNSSQKLLYATNAINGFTNSILIAGRSKTKTFQDLLRLIELFFKCGSLSLSIKELFLNSFSKLNIDSFLNIIPQLLCRVNILEKDPELFEILKNLLVNIGKNHPRICIFSLIVLYNSRNKLKKLASSQILRDLSEYNENIRDLIRESILFINEMNRCAMLLQEEWFEAIDESSKMFFNENNISGMISLLLTLHQKTNRKPETMNEVHFYQIFKSSLKKAEKMLREYIKTQDIIILRLAWEIYHGIYRVINDKYKNLNTLYLQNISPKLYKLKNCNLCIPGLYENTYYNTTKTSENLIKISHINPNLTIFNTKQHPRKISIYGTNEKEYMFLLKGHEDLRQDAQAMQFFDLVNTLLLNDRDTTNKNLSINTYSVLPLSQNTGIIGWVPNCDTFHKLIKEQRSKSNIIPNVEHKTMYSLNPKFESATFMTKLEIFKEALRVTHGTELNKILWVKSQNCEKWLERRTNYSRSLAVMSIVGYVLGLGDRHPSNLMMDRESGKVIHIDFGDCFEVAMKRNKFPERVPFRLTRMLIKALEVSGIEGTFRITCENVNKVLRDNKDSLIAIFASFIHDPLVSFRIMIPMIMKKNKLKANVENSKRRKSQYLKDNNNTENQINNKRSLSRIFNNDNDNNSNIIYTNKLKNGNNNNNINNNGNEDNNIVIDEEEEKKERKKMENDERQMLNLFEERDDIESEELNKIAKLVLDRIKDKLSGTDFNKNIIYDYKMQVDKLIIQATFHENLAQSYLGWCPFW